jgi:hypothetical protein
VHGLFLPGPGALAPFQLLHLFCKCHRLLVGLPKSGPYDAGHAKDNLHAKPRVPFNETEKVGLKKTENTAVSFGSCRSGTGRFIKKSYLTEKVAIMKFRDNDVGRLKEDGHFSRLNDVHPERRLVLTEDWFSGIIIAPNAAISSPDLSFWVRYPKARAQGVVIPCLGRSERIYLI